jgi:hypothetical protein
VEVERGRRTPRHHGRLGQQRSTASPGNPRQQRGHGGRPKPLDEDQESLLARYVEAFESYDVDSLTSLLYEDATWSMQPYELWLQTHIDVHKWHIGPSIACCGPHLVAVEGNSSLATGQYKPRRARPVKKGR